MRIVRRRRRGKVTGKGLLVLGGIVAVGAALPSHHADSPLQSPPAIETTQPGSLPGCTLTTDGLDDCGQRPDAPTRCGIEITCQDYNADPTSGAAPYVPVPIPDGDGYCRLCPHPHITRHGHFHF